jgi:ABC-2 type transport system permease protein
MTTATVTAPPTALAPARKPLAASRVAFRALILRDLVVLRKTLGEFIPRTILQPFLLVFVFTYVFPIAAVVPATPVHLDINWLVLLTLIPLACYTCGALGLTFGTRFDPRTVPLLFGIIVIPITFLGCIYYSWSSLSTIKWLQIIVLVNPLVYISEGFRAALTNSPHMSLWAVYGALIGFAALFTWLGINGFKRRVLS